MTAVEPFPAIEIRRAQITKFAVLSLWLAVAAGLLGTLYYTPLAGTLKASGLTMQSLRPLHLLAGTGWIYLGGLAVVAHYWGHVPASGARQEALARALRFLLHTWILGAGVVAASLAIGRFGGREYFFASTPASVLFWSGWVVLAWTFLRGLNGRGERQPVYIWMWATSFGLFTYSFLETHVFLLPYFQSHPLRDMAVEWKSYGTLVGSFNLLVYGSLSYLGARLDPSSNYARSRLAFALFWVGVLNSFTNYGHHTYHLPQSSIVKWISFSISMTETLILAKVVADLFGWARRARSGQRWDTVTWLLAGATLWTFLSLALSIAISIPPVNALIHGTFVVAAHAMGSMLGIDTLALLAVHAWMQRRDNPTAPTAARWPVVALNAGMLALWATFLAIGTDDSLQRWTAGILPSASLWPGWFGAAFVSGGALIVAGVFGLTGCWVLGFGAAEERAPVLPVPGNAGWSASDTAIFGSLGIMLIGLYFVLGLAAMADAPEGWRWGARMIDRGQVGCVVAVLGVIAVIAAAARRVRGPAARLVFGASGASAVLLLGFFAADFSEKAARGFLPGTAFRPLPRYSAARFGAQPTRRDDSISVPGDPGDEETPARRGRRLYVATCSSCHGMRGQGLPGHGKDLRISEVVAGPNGDLIRLIADGRPSTDPANSTRVAMPPRGGNPLLSDADVAAIAEHVRGLATPEVVDAGVMGSDGSNLSGNAIEAEPVVDELAPRSVLPPAQNGQPGLAGVYLASLARLPWQPPANAGLFFAVWFAGRALATLLVLSAGVLSWAVVVRGAGDAPRWAATALSWCWGAGCVLMGVEWGVVAAYR